MIQSHLGYSVNFFSIFMAGAVSLIIIKKKLNLLKFKDTNIWCVLL